MTLLALDKDYAAGRTYVGKIEDSSFRQRAQAWVDLNLVVRAIEQKKVNAALELARGGALTPIQRVWVWSRAAELLAKTEPDKASALLDDAL